MSYRIGSGVDFHVLVEGRDLWIGGVKIPHHKGALGHSDADVLLHAICDAMLGALGLGDIGMHFPDTSTEFKNIDSKILLKRSFDLITERGYCVVNVDSTLCLQAPKIAPFVQDMRNSISGILQLLPEDVSIKATTTEKLGFVGREEGLQAFATVLLEKKLTVSNQNITVKIINLSDHSHPEYATAGASGMDIKASITEPIVIAPSQRVAVPTGIKVEIPLGFEIQIRPRSGLALNHGITCLNTPGTIDSDYRGEIKVILINLSEKEYTVSNGDRIAQMVLASVEKISWEKVSLIHDSERGSGGFGHTGK